MIIRLLTDGYVDDTGPHRGVPPTQEDYDRMELILLHRRIFSGPYDAIIEQEMTIEEAKRRYPNNPIPGQEK